MEDIQTAHWTETRTRYGRFDVSGSFDGEQERKSTTRVWLRLNPPAHAWRNEFEDSWSHDVRDARGHLHTASTWDQCHLYPLSHPETAENLRENLRRQCLPPPVSGAQSQERNTDRTPRRYEWQQETTELEGQAVIRWHLDYVENNFQVSLTYWSEPETGRLVRKERRETDLLTGQLAVIDVCDQYTYNEEPPEGTYEMPPGKPVVTPNMGDTMPEVWNSLSAREQQAIQKTITRSDVGWQQGDFGGFASVWEFGRVPSAPTLSEWQARVEQQTGRWNRWESAAISARMMNFVPIRVATYTFLMPRQRSKIFGVTVKVKVAWDEGKEWEGDAEYFLRRKGKGYRVVHWDCPWEEIQAARQTAV
jgi:hypothetical protein